MYINNNKMLSEVIKDYDVCRDMLIESVDKRTIGNHHVGNFVEALDLLGKDFIVDTVEDNDDQIKITLDDNFNDDMNDLRYESNRSAIAHDRYLGDGKYWKQENTK